MSPLAKAIYKILRARVRLPEPRITYAQLVEELRDTSEEFDSIYPRSQKLSAALGVVGKECRRRGLPGLPALVVRADTRRPGDAYFEGGSSGLVFKGEKIAAWRQLLEEIKRTRYPAR